MSLATLPPRVAPHEPILRIGVPFPAVSGVRDTLDRTLPGPAVAGLEGLWTQIQAQIFEPLLQTPTAGELPAQFQKLHHRFVTYDLAIGLSLLAAFEDDVTRAQAVVTEAWDATEKILLAHAPGRIGRDASLAALLGVQTLRRVAEAAMRRPVPLDSGVVLELAANLTAFMLASLPVTFALLKEELSGRLVTNATILAYWSREYALRAYDLAKRIGLLLEPSRLTCEIPAGDDDDRALANLGLEDYRAALEHDEQG